MNCPKCGASDATFMKREASFAGDDMYEDAYRCNSCGVKERQFDEEFIIPTCFHVFEPIPLGPISRETVEMDDDGG